MPLSAMELRALAWYNLINTLFPRIITLHPVPVDIFIPEEYPDDHPFVQVLPDIIGEGNAAGVAVHVRRSLYSREVSSLAKFLSDVAQGYRVNERNLFLTIATEKGIEDIIRCMNSLNSAHIADRWESMIAAVFRVTILPGGRAVGKQSILIL